MFIQKHEWKHSESNSFFLSLKKQCNLSQAQFYTPFYSLFFKMKNNQHSHKQIDFRRQYYLRSIHSIVSKDTYHSNKTVQGTIYDFQSKKEYSQSLFMKQISVLDTNHIFLNHYNLLTQRPSLLPSTYNYITFSKVNSLQNSSYIDCFLSYLFSLLTEKNKLPTFPIYYGCVNGMTDHYQDITEDIPDLETFPGFFKGNQTLYDINVYTTNKEKLEQHKDLEDISSDSENDEEDDYIAHFKKIPVLQLFLESLEGTLEDVIHSPDFKLCELLSLLFQISFALLYLQTTYSFVHNDLHVNNIMFQTTEESYLYYKYQDTCYKIPTYGKIYKIIDYGRSMFRLNQRFFLNDSFDKHGEADTQYDWKNINLNYNFDLCRLSTTILDELQESSIPDMETNPIYELLVSMIRDKSGNLIYNGEDSFQLYVDITEKAVNSKPDLILNHSLMKQFQIKEDENKTYFKLD